MTTFQCMSDDPGPPATVEARAEQLPIYDIYLCHKLSDETVARLSAIEQEIEDGARPKEGRFKL